MTFKDAMEILTNIPDKPTTKQIKEFKKALKVAANSWAKPV